MKTSRRRFIKLWGAVALTLATGGAGALLNSCAVAQTETRAEAGGPTTTQPPAATVPPASTPSASDYGTLDPRKPDNFTAPLNLPRADGGLLGVLDVPAGRLDLSVSSQAVDIFRGVATNALAYRAQHNGKTYLNPILRLQNGSAFAARLSNGLGEPTIVHWHGLHLDWHNDGHPSYAVGQGQSYDYAFTLQNRAASYWYHPHAHQLSGGQAHRGLASFFLVQDEDEARLTRELDLQFGVTDLPLLIQDKRFDDRGQFVYLSQGPMEQFSGFLGDVITANLSVNPSLDVSTRVYRLRLLNGSNGRTYRLAFSKGNDRLPFHLIGTDGGLLDQPRQVNELFLSSGERADVLLDLRALAPGDVVFLRSLAFDPMHNEMGGMMGGAMPHGGHGGMPGMGMGGQGATPGPGQMGGMSPSRLDEGEAFYVLKLAVRNRVVFDKPVPKALAEVKPLATTDAHVRTIDLSASGMEWLINGQRFAMDKALFATTRTATEIWEIKNAQASMPHPVHVHGFQFQVLERRNSPQQVQSLAVDSAKRLPTDLGWKDTVLVWPGETVRIALDFANTFAGEQTYLLHCHNLEHEDQGMMANYRVA